jgi:hypothetical protein
MKVQVLNIFLLISLGHTVVATAQETIQAYPVATNFTAVDKVLELNIPAEMDGARFFVVFQNDDGEQRLVPMAARAGKHSYELRHLPQWRGNIEYVATLDRPLKGSVKTPTMADNIDMFLQPERIMPTTINFVSQHTILGWPWTYFLILISVVSAICFLMFTKKLVVSGVLAFLVAWGVMDLRAIFDHAVIVYQKEKSAEEMPPFEQLNVFVRNASDVIGHATWGHGPVDALSTSYLRYQLAEHPYATGGSARIATFWVTQHPSEGQVVLQHGRFYLVRKDNS